jgi:hypothetical protein
MNSEVVHAGAIGGAKRRHYQCPSCQAAGVFYKKSDFDAWCRRHGKVCTWMRVNFYIVTDIPWVKYERVKLTAPDRYEWTSAKASLPVKQDLSVEDLIGSVGGISIIDAVDIITSNKRQISDTGSSVSSISTNTNSGMKTRPVKIKDQVPMIPAEVIYNFINLFIRFYLLIIISFFIGDASRLCEAFLLTWLCDENRKNEKFSFNVDLVFSL